MKIRFTFDLSQAEAHPGRRELAELYDLSLIENLETAEHLERCYGLACP